MNGVHSFLKTLHTLIMNSNLTAIALIALIISLVVFGPWVTIWTLNTLFPLLAIPFNLATWFAVIWLGAFFKTTVKTK
jgi:hypothetical protein